MLLVAVLLAAAPAGKGSVKYNTEPCHITPAFSEQSFELSLQQGWFAPVESSFSSKPESTKSKLTRESFQVEMARLDRLARDGNLDALVKAGDMLEERWGKQGGEFYGQLMLNIANLMVNGFKDEKIYSLSQKYITQALEKSNTFSLELETRLLPFLAFDIFSRSPTSEEFWVRERSTKARLWLHAWQRLESQINRNFNFSDRPILNVTPPAKTGLPSGVSPFSIKDLKLRAKYQALIAANTAKAQEYNRQFSLRYLDSLFPKRAEQYLVRAYSKPPDRLPELKHYLIAYRLSKDVRDKLVEQIVRNRSATK